MAGVSDQFQIKKINFFHEIMSKNKLDDFF